MDYHGRATSHRLFDDYKPLQAILSMAQIIRLSTQKYISSYSFNVNGLGLESDPFSRPTGLHRAGIGHRF